MKLDLIAVAAGAVALILAPSASAQGNNSPEHTHFPADVAEDTILFVDHRLAASVKPVRGSSFVPEGKIFPACTISSSNGGQFEVNRDAFGRAPYLATNSPGAAKFSRTFAGTTTKKRSLAVRRDGRRMAERPLGQGKRFGNPVPLNGSVQETKS